MLLRYKKLFKITLFLIWGVLLIAGIIGTALFLEHSTIKEGASLLKQYIGENIHEMILVILLLYVLRTIIFIPVGILGPLIAFVLPGRFWLAFFLIGSGMFLSAILSFGLGRLLGREWVAEHESERLKRFDAAVKERGFFTVFLIRLLIFLPFDPVNIGSGLSSIRFKHYFWATLLGVWPEALYEIFIGNSFSNPKNLIWVAALVLFGAWWIRFLKRHPHFKDILNPIKQIEKFQKQKKRKQMNGKRRRRF
ncbi:TVP38/TMEM64 family protein [Candidatus Peregrinibacteria bacterium]|nr:TVP38/TMEM64 family protein [Candidatus Peregrinibacteria bacterium]